MKINRPYVSTLQLAFDVPGGNPDWPVVQILVDGRDIYSDHRPGWQGFDPEDMLGPRCPLLPDRPGRRTALYRCSCGVAGCGVIAPVVVAFAESRRIAWMDHRNYVGVFDTPLAPQPEISGGMAWEIPDLRFDHDQYVAEVERASADRSWETPRRITARLVTNGLRSGDVETPSGVHLDWVAPAWDGTGVTIAFCSSRSERQHLIAVVGAGSGPEAAAADVLDQLRSTTPDLWQARFGLR